MVVLVLVVAFVSIAWLFGALALGRAGAARPGADERFDAVVVLGCRVMPDGTPGPAFRRRVELGCELLRAGHAPRLVITGGRVAGPVAEAESARDYVSSRALAPLDAVVLEPEARTTRDNARRTRELLGDARVLVVSCAWHVPRARRVFSRCFTHARGAGARGSFRDAMREVPKWLVSLVRQ